MRVEGSKFRVQVVGSAPPGMVAEVLSRHRKEGLRVEGLEVRGQGSGLRL